MPDDRPPATADAIRVWDLPTRLFHWLLAAVVAAALVTGWLEALDWHIRLGLLALTLVVFRLLWGLVGGYWSRFASFIYAPATLLRYLRGQAAESERLDVGHSPTGALSVFGLLALLALQIATGLVADDEVAHTGPLNRYVSGAVVSKATGWHTGWGQWLIFAMVLLHVAAIVFYRVKKQRDLVRPMLTGDKPLPAGTPASADGPPQHVLALVLLLACLGLAGWVWKLGM